MKLIFRGCGVTLTLSQCCIII